jgi:hypothetical protein
LTSTEVADRLEVATPRYPFFFFSAMMLLQFALTLFVLPETKGPYREPEHLLSSMQGISRNPKAKEHQVVRRL